MANFVRTKRVACEIQRHVLWYMKRSKLYADVLAISALFELVSCNRGVWISSAADPNALQKQKIAYGAFVIKCFVINHIPNGKDICCN